MHTKPLGRDLVALRVEVTGATGRRAARQLLDFYDEQHGISAMMRATGYSLAVTGMMQVDGRITAHGVHTPDEAVPVPAYVGELGKRGVEIPEGLDIRPLLTAPNSTRSPTTTD